MMRVEEVKRLYAIRVNRTDGDDPASVRGCQGGEAMLELNYKGVSL